MKDLFIFILIFLILTLSCESPGKSKSPKGKSSSSSSSAIALEHFSKFMTIDGNNFADNFKFLGANLDPWRFITEDGEVYSYNEMRAIVKNARDYIGAKVIRMHINGGAFEPTIGNYSEETFRQLDYFIAACVEYKVYALICLRDYLWGPWPDGSFGDYAAYDPYWYMAGGTVNAPNKNAILTDADTLAAYKNFICYILNRINTVTNVAYKNETNILGWELINEPNVLINTSGTPDTVFNSTKLWLSDISNYVKSIDPNHLTAVASYGVDNDFFGTSGSDQWWNEINVPAIDFIDIHYYADASLYDPIDAANEQKIRDRVGKVLSFGKPCVVGEFGCVHTQPLQTVLNLYSTIITNSLAQGASGVMPYSWGPDGPNGWGGTGGFCSYIDDTEICTLLKNLAP